MKKLLPILFLSFFVVNCYAQKNDCDKHFIKEKKQSKKSSIFSEEKLVQTKFLRFYRNGSRQLLIGFKKTDRNYVIIQQYSEQTLSFKEAFVLGIAIRIGIIFDDNENYILKFPDNENKKISGEVLPENISSNEAPLDSSFDTLLKNHMIVKIEIQNPFNGLNQSKVRSEDVSKKDAEIINETYNCFLARGF